LGVEGPARTAADVRAALDNARDALVQADANAAQADAYRRSCV
jgi:hypothetical protein